MKTPDETVSENITAALLEKGLVTAEDAKKLAGKLARGEVKDSEWLTLLRMAVPQPKPTIKEGAE